jgi:transposase
MFTEPNISPVERACVARTDPGHLIGDNAYDSDKLAAQLRYYGIEVVVPHRSNGRIKTQDERCLRRYRRRRKIERLLLRRLVARYERDAENFLGMPHLVCCLILLRHLGDGSNHQERKLPGFATLC